MTPAQMAALTNTVLRNYARDLRNAKSDADFDRLAARAEGLYATDLGARERELVDHERNRRAEIAKLDRQQVTA